MKKSVWPTVILIVVFLIGLSLLLYPSVSDYWNSLHQSKAIADYSKTVSNINDDKYEQLLSDAIKYNESLLGKGNRYVLTEKEEEEYNSLLSVSETGIIGYIEIPSIDCSLPIYHGTSEEILQVGVGHIEGSSLPVGGESTHCVLSGHRGLPSARLFTDIDKLTEGDIFIIRVLDETLTYEVDKISIVLPEETDQLAIEEGKDLCTLVTCTPYGINTHRLLVRGHRVANQDESGSIRVTADAMAIDPMIVAPMVAVPILVALLVVLIVSTRRKKK